MRPTDRNYSDRHTVLFSASKRDELTGLMLFECIVIKCNETGEIIIPKRIPHKLRAYLKQIYPTAD